MLINCLFFRMFFINKQYYTNLDKMEKTKKR